MPRTKITQRKVSTAVEVSKARLAPGSPKKKASEGGGHRRRPDASTYRLNKTNAKRKPAARRASPREKLQREA